MSRNTQGLHTVQGQIPEEILRIQFLTRRSQPKDIVGTPNLLLSETTKTPEKW